MTSQARSEKTAQTLEGAAFALLMVFFAMRLLVSSLAHETGAPSVNRLAEAIVFSAAFLWILACVARGRLRLPGGLIGASILVFTLSVVASAALASCRFPALAQAFYFVSAVLAFMVLLDLARDGTRMRTAFALLIGVGAIVAAAGLIEYFEIRPMARSNWTAGQGRAVAGAAHTAMLEERLFKQNVYSTFNNPNTLAGFLALFVFLAAGAFAAAVQKRNIAAMLGTGAALAAGLLVFVLARSTGAWAALLFGLGIFVIIYKLREKGRTLRKALAVYLGACVLLASAFAVVSSVRGNIFTSAEVRIEYWQAAGSIIAEHPVLGAGAGSFPDLYLAHKSAVAEETRLVHNNYLQLWAENGIAALLAFLVFWGVVLKRTASLRKIETPAENGKTAITLFLVSLAGILLLLAAIFLFSGIVHFPLVAWENFLIAGMVLLFVSASAFMAFGRETRPGAPVLTAAAAVFLAHSLMDFDLYSGGCLAAALLVAASGGYKTRRVSLSFAGKAALALPAAALLAVFVFCVLLPGLKADRARYAGRICIMQARELKTVSPLRYALAEYKRAVGYTPSDATLHATVGGTARALWVASGEDEYWKLALESFKRASELEPLNHAPWYMQARLLAEKINHAPATERPELLGRSEKLLDRAIERYPTRACYRLMRGDLLVAKAALARDAERKRLGREADAEFQKALEYHEACRSRSAKLTDGELEFLHARLKKTRD